MKAENSHERIKVLLIEDDEEDYLVTRNLFSRFKDKRYSLDWVPNCREGLARALRNEDDVILVDYYLGESDGLELLRTARAKGCRLPMILLTGSSSHGIDIEALNSGAADYLVKGDTSAELLERTLRYTVALHQRQKLAEEGNRFLEVSLDMLCIAGSDGYYKRLNPAWEKTLGFTMEELMSKPYVEFVHPEDRDNTKLTAAELEDGIPTFSFENRYRCKDGSYKWLSWRATPLSESKLIYAVARDITQKKEQEEILRESREQIINIFESITDAFYALDENWNFTYINPTGEQLLKRSRESLIGRNIWEEFPFATSSAFYSAYHQVMNDRVSKNFTEFYPDPLNSWYEIQAYPAKNGISVYFRNVTEQKRAADALVLSEEKYRLLTKATNDIIWDWNLLTDQLQWNEAMNTLFGYSLQEISDAMEWCKQRIHPEDVERVILGLQAVLDQKNQVWSDEYRFRKADGTFAIVLDRGFVIYGDSGEPIRMVGSMFDLTEKKQFEEALIGSAKQLAEAQSLAKLGSWRMDFKTQEIYWSDEAYRIFGLQPKEIKASLENFLERVHPEDRKKARELAERAVRTGQGFEYHHRIILPDKSIRIVYQRGKVNKDEAGNFSGLVGTVQDVTDRRLAEEELKKSQKQLAEAQHIARLGSWEIDIIQQKVDWSDEAYHIFGFRPGEIEPALEHFIAAVHPDDQMRVQEYALRGVEANQEFYYRIVAPDQDVRTIYQRSIVVKDEAGSPLKVLGTVQDVTENKNAEEALRKSETQFHAVFDNSLDSILIADDTGKYLSSNPAACTLLGASKEEIVKRGIKDFVNPGRKTEADAAWKHFLECGEQRGEFELTTLDGRTLNVEFTAVANFLPGQHLSVLRDITERKKTELEQARLAAIVESSNDAIIGKSLDGIITSWNHAAEDLFGFTAAETIGRHRSLLIPLGHSDEEAEIIQRIKHGGSPEHYESKRLHKNGHLIDVSITVSPVNDNGKTVGVSVIARDITERKRVEAELQASEERYRYLTNAMPQLVWATDRNGSHVYYNQQWFDFTGLSEEESLGFGFINALHPDDKERTLERWERAWRDGESYYIEYRFFSRSQNQYRWFLGRGVPVRNELGEITQWVGTCTDIEDQKRSEERVRLADLRALAEYETLLDRVSRLAETFGTARDLKTIYGALKSFALDSTSCSGIFVSLFNSKQQIRVPSYAWSEGVEVDVASLPPMGMTDSPHSRAITTGRTIITNDFQEVMEGKPAVHLGLDADPMLPQSSLASPMSIMGRIIGAVEVQSTKRSAFKKEHATAIRMAANLTANAIENVRLLEQERRKDEQIQRSQKLESVGRLAGGIAHDFNNMLTAINGYSDLVLRQLDKDNPIRGDIEEIKKAGNRSAALTHQLLAFSRQQVLQPQKLDLNEVVNDTIKMLHRLIGEDIQLNISLSSEPCLLEADSGQLAQVLMNLSINARDAMPQGGKLTIETTRVYLDENYALLHEPAKTGKYVMLSVSDTGTGIDKEIQQYIFDPFFTTKEIGKGTGLGLATVYGIVKQSQGYIWVYSEIGKGTTFKVYLPMLEEENKIDNQDEALGSSPTGTESILLVEDELLVRNLSCRILEKCGYEVITAKNGIEALEIINKSETKINLLITDVVMPEMSGRELTEILKVSHPQLKVLFMSGYTDDTVFRHGIIDTKSPFIQKPFSFDNLSMKVREILDQPNNPP